MPRLAPLLLTLLFSLPGLAARSVPPTPFRVVAYLPDYRAGTLNPAAPVLNDLTDLIFFSLEPTPVGGLDAARLTPAVTAKLQAVKRRRFAQALTLFCLGHGFGGADFGWEHPAGYAALLAETQRTFAPHGLRLSITVAPWQRLAPAGIAAVDAVNLMAYDHEGATPPPLNPRRTWPGSCASVSRPENSCSACRSTGARSPAPIPLWLTPTS